MTEPEKQEAEKHAELPTEQHASMSTSVSASQDPESGVDQAVIGPAWMYKPLFKIGKWEAPYFASPEMQLYLVSFVCFLCPGMFNAVSGLGGGGQINTHDVNNANTALYSTFAVVGFFAGSIANRIGLRLTLSLGGFGYFLYVASLLSYNINENAGFLVFAGALLGVCAGLLWCAQGAVMLSYPHEHEKGKYIAIFWVIFNLGGVIGSLVRSLAHLESHQNNILISTGPSRPKYALDLRQRQQWHLHCLPCSDGHWLRSLLVSRRLQARQAQGRLARYCDQEPNLEV